MLGDETWLKLFPGLFKRHDGVSSFYVSYLPTLKKNIIIKNSPSLSLFWKTGKIFPFFLALRLSQIIQDGYTLYFPLSYKVLKCLYTGPVCGCILHKLL